MNAPALATAATPAPGQAQQATAQGAAAPGAGSLEVFEALLAAMLPQDPTVGVVASGAKPRTAGLETGTGKAADETTESSVDADPGADTAQPGAAAGDANAVLAALMMAGRPAIAEAAPAAGNPVSTEAAPPAWGRGKIAGVPAAPALANRAALAPGKPDTGPVSAGDETELDASPQLAGATPPGKTTILPAQAPQSPQSPPAPSPAAASDVTPNPTVQTATADLPDVPPPVAQAGSPGVEAAAVDPTAQALTAGQAARPEPAPAPAPGARPSRTERARAADEGRIAERLQAGPAGIRQTAASAAADAKSPELNVDAGDPAVAEAEVEDADSPDGVMQAESRATAQSLTPAAHTAHTVRGSPETVANLAAQIIKKLEGKSTRFDLELNPAGLGRVDVRLEIGAHGRITAAMTCDNPQAAAELKARSSELQQALEQAGFDMSGGMSFDVAGDRGQQQRQAWQDQNDNNGEAFRGRAFRAALDTAGDAADTAVNGALRLRRGVNAGLDLRI